MDYTSFSGGSTPLTPSSTSNERQGMIDPRWKRPLVVLFQQGEHPELNTHKAASFIEDIKAAILEISLKIKGIEERLQAMENTCTASEA
ncbi:uncharacterized protein FRV6_11800 [Fusarium oxysporum]|uniref:Uncharacterized protein n=1 Tax=Fusarium oxysporum TaxID=5507 RepID=A0A2H3TG47_FUSOX|nr:uncharacterized protein FRV6_11800 [Fusarium oxysporum]